MTRVIKISKNKLSETLALHYKSGAIMIKEIFIKNGSVTYAENVILNEDEFKTLAESLGYVKKGEE